VPAQVTYNLTQLVSPCIPFSHTTLHLPLCCPPCPRLTCSKEDMKRCLGFTPSSISGYSTCAPKRRQTNPEQALTPLCREEGQ